MCGITGWIDWEKDLRTKKETLEKMLQTLTPRGPDERGVWFSPRAALGHCRLVVVDPRGGKQPMTRNKYKNSYTITYNGELYNTEELRQELKSRGYNFYSKNSDTEALLLSYIEWGSQCLKYLNGIFAFAIWDQENQKLFMARDRLGVKPLFYTLQKKSLLFGSELKALLAHPLVSPEVDSQGLAEIFVLGPSRTPGHGVFKGINELKPGHFLFYSPEGLHEERYWRLESKPHMDDTDTTAEIIKCLLKDIVAKQLVSDVPVCTLLSGGVDSSALTALAAGALKNKGKGSLHTYSVHYRDNKKYFQSNSYQPNSDDSWVDYVSQCLNTCHHHIMIDIPDLVTSLENSMRARDLPGMADIDSSLYLFCREIKKESTVGLSGEAADEIFGGYPWFSNEDYMKINVFPWMRSISSRMDLLSQDTINKIKPHEYLARRLEETMEEVPVLEGEGEIETQKRKLFYLNMIWFMTTLLDRKDRMSMAQGLEIRVPFCDHRLVEYAWNVPWKMKITGNQEKGILRKALKGIVPQEVLNRRKSPYPKTFHPEYLSAVKGILSRILEDPNSSLQPLVNVNKLKNLLKVKENVFNPPWFGQLMGDAQYFAYMYQVEAWLKEYGVRIV